MARLPFNPDRIGGPPAPAVPAGRRAGDGPPAMSVTQANKMVKDALARALPERVRIVGQVSNFSDRSHWYFSIKDAGSSLRCVCFASVARKCNVPMADGLEIVVSGRFDVYDPQGQLQFYVDKIEPVGQGSLEMQFRALCNELRELGYFDPQHKKELPLIPRKIAVVTSRTGAALQDVINTAARRWAGCELLLVDVRVQGAEAAPQVAWAIKALSRQGQAMGIDAILLTRGGGSMEDLWAFNERIVADAIYQCRLPIVAAIGHETDTTIAELVADMRCATPTQAAMTLIPDRQALDHQIHQLHRRLHLLVSRQLEYAQQRLNAAARHAFFRQPANMLLPVQSRLQALEARLQESMKQTMRDRQLRLDGLMRHLSAVSPLGQIRAMQPRVEAIEHRLTQAMSRALSQRQQKIEALSRHLSAVGPASVLGRGYTYTLDAQGRPVTQAAGLQPGQRMTTVFADGKVRSVVEGGDQPAAASPAASPDPAPQPASPPKRPRRKAESAGPMLDLFSQSSQDDA